MDVVAGLTCSFDESSSRERRGKFAIVMLDILLVVQQRALRNIEVRPVQNWRSMNVYNIKRVSSLVDAQRRQGISGCNCDWMITEPHVSMVNQE